MIPANYVWIALLVSTLLFVGILIFIFSIKALSHSRRGFQFKLWLALCALSGYLGGVCAPSLISIAPNMGHSAREAVNLAGGIFWVVGLVALFRWLILLKQIRGRSQAPE